MTYYLEANGLQVIACRVTVPGRGAWVGDVEVNSDLPLPGPTVTLLLGDLVIVGAIVRQAPYGGVQRARLVGGFGGWSRPVLPRAYQNPAGIPAALVLTDAALEVGEVLVGGSPESLGSDYVRELGPASRVLAAIVGSAWWIDPTGVTHVEPRAPGQLIPPEYTVEDYDGATGRLVAAPEVLAPWLPGALVANELVPTPRVLSSVTFVADNEGSLRVDALTEAVAA